MAEFEDRHLVRHDFHGGLELHDHGRAQPRRDTPEMTGLNVARVLTMAVRVVLVAFMTFPLFPEVGYPSDCHLAGAQALTSTVGFRGWVAVCGIGQ